MKGKFAKRIMVLLVAGLLVSATGACGKGTENDTFDVIDEIYSGGTEEDNRPDDSYGGFGGDDFGADSSQRKPAVAVEGQYKTVFHKNDGAEGTDIWCYLVWDGNRSNVRMVFFGENNEGEISFTEMDGENYYGKPTGTVKVGGKSYDAAAEFSMQSQYEGYANLQIRTSGGETEFLGLDGVASIEPIPSKFKGCFFGTYLDPLMILSGDDYRLTAQLSNYTDSYTVENIFYCCSCWDEEKNYSLSSLNSFSYCGGENDNFELYTDERDQKTVNLMWLRYDESWNRVAGTEDFSTYYYYFYDHKAPADYENHDSDGKWGKITVDAPAGIFEPATDDYIIKHETTTWSGWDEAAKDSKIYDVEVYDLYSFDEKGICVQDIRLTVFPSDDGAQLYYKNVGSYLDTAIDGRYALTDDLTRNRNTDYIKKERVGFCLGGESSYDDRTWYEDVHYYEYTIGYYDSDSVTQVYLSKPPKAKSLEEHMAILDRCGSYEAADTQVISIGFDDKDYEIFLYDNSVTDEVWFYDSTHDITFTADGFDAVFHDVNYQVLLHGEYISEGIKATISIVPRDPSEMDDSRIKPNAMTAEKIYPFTAKKPRSH